MSRLPNRSRAPGTVLLPLLALACLPAAAGGGAELWPGFAIPSGAGVEAAASTGAAERLIAEAAAGDRNLAIVARRAGTVASAFRVWASEQLGPGPAYGDAEEPAPAGWAARAAPRLAASEAGALLAALTGEAGEAAPLTKEVLRVRFRRVAVLHAGAMQALRSAERSEGVALYTALRALEEAEGPEAEQLAQAVRRQILDRLRAAASGHLAAYSPAVSGCALALLADRARPGWRREMLDRGLPLEVVLAGPPRAIR